MQTLKLCLKSFGEEVARDASLGLGTADDLVVDAVVQPRDGDEESGTERLRILEEPERSVTIRGPSESHPRAITRQSSRGSPRQVLTCRSSRIFRVSPW